MTCSYVFGRCDVLPGVSVVVSFGVSGCITCYDLFAVVLLVELRGVLSEVSYVSVRVCSVVFRQSSGYRVVYCVFVSSLIALSFRLLSVFVSRSSVVTFIVVSLCLLSSLCRYAYYLCLLSFIICHYAYYPVSVCLSPAVHQFIFLLLRISCPYSSYALRRRNIFRDMSIVSVRVSFGRVFRQSAITYIVALSLSQ